MSYLLTLCWTSEGLSMLPTKINIFRVWLLASHALTHPRVFSPTQTCWVCVGEKTEFSSQQVCSIQWSSEIWCTQSYWDSAETQHNAGNAAKQRGQQAGSCSSASATCGFDEGDWVGVRQQSQCYSTLLLFPEASCCRPISQSESAVFFKGPAAVRRNFDWYLCYEICCCVSLVE